MDLKHFTVLIRDAKLPDVHSTVLIRDSAASRMVRLMGRSQLPDVDPTLPAISREVVEKVADRLLTINPRSRMTIPNIIGALCDVYPQIGRLINGHIGASEDSTT